MPCSSVDTHQCFCETCCLRRQDIRRLRQQVPIKWLYLSTGLNRVTICMPVLVAVWAACTANLDVIHRFVCYKSCFIKVSACARTHAVMHAETMFPNYTQKQVRISHKWYVLKIKNEIHTPVEYTFGHMICSFCISLVIIYKDILQGLLICITLHKNKPRTCRDTSATIVCFFIMSVLSICSINL
jgi:hypothetical protein